MIKPRLGFSYNKGLAVALKSTKAETLEVSVVLFAFIALLLLSTENKKFKTSVVEHRVETDSGMCTCSCVREVSSSDDVICKTWCEVKAYPEIDRNLQRSKVELD